MTLLDHLLFFGLAVVYPIMAIVNFRKLRRRIAAGEAIGPAELYKSTITGHWVLFAIGIAIWLFADRGWEALGFSLQFDKGFLAGLALTIVAVIVLVRFYGGLAHADEKTRESFLEQIGDLDCMLPQDKRDLRLFYALSVTAGIVEEMLWRGYMFWYLGHVMPIWAAAIVSSLLFGLGHAYQGMANVPKVALVGGVFAGLYILTGSVWLPMLLHAVFDAVQGRAACAVISQSAVDAQPAASAGREPIATTSRK